ncbi:MAG: hypothetical protein EZS28_042872, partial [Streblomastix strix]
KEQIEENKDQSQQDKEEQKDDLTAQDDRDILLSYTDVNREQYGKNMKSPPRSISPPPYILPSPDNNSQSEQNNSSPSSAQTERQIICPFCENEFQKEDAFSHAQQCSTNPQHKLLFTSAQLILPQMEQTEDGFFHQKQGLHPLCPICNKVPIFSIENHFFSEHHDENQIFRKLLQFHNEMQQP